MAYDVIASALNRAIGLDTASIGATALACAVQSRVAARKLSGPEAYAAELEGDAQELRALVEAVVVPETWFFRDRDAFDAVGEFALARVGELGPGVRLRLVSLPCSTGEEPYSLAMTLLDAGLSPDTFEIHAFDVSRAAIDRALAGAYGRNSFRGDDLAFRARRFSQTANGWRIDPEVAACVRFSQANLLEIEAATTRGTYDIVFCRNLLIYFDPATQQRAIQILRGLMRPTGCLFVGPGEANLMLGAGLASVQRPRTFCFREPTKPAEPAAVAASRSRPAPRPAPKPVRRAFAKAAASPVAERAEARPSLADARRLADLGRIADAVRACEAHLAQAAPSAEAWSLLGVLWEAAHEPGRAADCYRKALYLDPNDAEALDHLALLLQRQGDAAGAGRMRERARRLSARETC